MIKRYLFAIAVVALAGCATIREETREHPAERPAEPFSYSAVPGQEPDIVAELRAAPAPDQPELIDGKSASGDEHLLEAKSFVRIGEGNYSGDAQAARAWVAKQARKVDADKVYIYTDATTATTRAVFYVRYRLPFGATFRALTADEQQTLGASGVQLGTIVGGTPASEANLLSGDFVLKFNGKNVSGKNDFQELLRANMGKRVTLTISRDGHVLDRLVRLGVLPSALHKDK